MSLLLKAIAQCLTGYHDEPIALHDEDEKTPFLLAEPKEQYTSPPDMSYDISSSIENDILLAETVIQIILGSQMGGKDLRDKLDFIEGEAGWSQEVAICMVSILEVEMMKETKMSPVMRDCRNRAWEVATTIDGFDIEEPGYRSLVAMGMLVIAAPSVIRAMGFVESGCLSGSFAASWYARYEFPEEESIFDFFLVASIGWEQEESAMIGSCPFSVVHEPVEQSLLGPWPPVLSPTLN